MPDDTPKPGWVYRPGDTKEAEKPQVQAAPESNSPATKAASPQKPEPAQSVSWTASEFIDHHKSASWYLLFIVGLGVLVSAVYFIAKDIISSAVIGFTGLLFIILASHKPREMAYKIDGGGITIGTKFYPYAQFKSFGIHRDGAIGAINLMPLKRFMPELSIYYPPEQENNIVEILAYHLPHDQREEQGVDRLLKKLKF